MRKSSAFWLLGLFVFGQLLLAEDTRPEEIWGKSPHSWSLSDAVRVLNESPWVRKETYTRLISGIGSGIRGEKEMYLTFYVRLLSARPVREAYARIQQLQGSYRNMDDEKRGQLDAAIQAAIELDTRRWVVLALGFRSSDPSQELTIRKFLETQTLESLQNNAYLSTNRLAQVRLAAYYPPLDDSVGAKFVFPREIDSVSIFDDEDSQFTFELDIPGADPRLRPAFPVWAVTDNRQDPPRAVPAGASGTDGQSLEGIRNYEMPILELESRSGIGSKRLQEVVNVFSIPRGGRVHGSVYWFHRNDNFDARNFFDPLGHPLPEYKRNQFGVTAGFPLGRNLNLLGSYEGLKINKGSTLLTHVPTSAQKSGDFRGFSEQLRDPFTGAPLVDNRIPESRINPVARKLLSMFPDPNRDDPDRNYVNNQPNVQNHDSFSIRGDYRWGERSKLVASYDYSNGNSILVDPLPAFGYLRADRNQGASISYSRNFSPRLVTEISLHYGRGIGSTRSQDPRKSGTLASLGIQGVSVSDPLAEGYPEFRLNGYAAPGDESSPQNLVVNGLYLDGSLSYSRGDHNFKTGAHLENHQANNYRSGGLRRGRFTFNGYYTGDAFGDFLYGLPDAASRLIGEDRSDLRATRWSWYVQDSWKINPHFTWSAALSYLNFQPFRSVHDNTSLFYPLLFEPPLSGELVVTGGAKARQLGLQGLGPGQVVYPDRNDWAPRLGLAYRPFGNNQLVLRASWWVSHHPLNRDEYLHYIGRNYPFYSVQTALSPVNLPQMDLSRPFDALSPTELTVSMIDPHLRTTYEHNLSLGVDYEFYKNWLFQISYFGQKSTHRLRTLPANIPYPGPDAVQPRRPNPGFGRFTVLTGSGAYTQHQAAVEVERRLSGGLAFNSTLVWNRTMNDTPRTNPSNPRDLRAERASSDYVKPLSFRLNYICDLPFGKGRAYGAGATGWKLWMIDGWRISGITRIDSGGFLTVTLPGDFNNDGVSGGDRPDRIASGRLTGVRPGVDQWFDTTAFVSPEPFTYGDAGRNILREPSSRVWDLSVIKRMSMADTHILEIRLELFNAFNHANFNPPGTTLGSSMFGKIFGAGHAREMEIAVKYMF